MNLFLEDTYLKPEDIYPGKKDFLAAYTIETVQNLLVKNRVEILSLDENMGPTLLTWMCENNRWPTKSVWVHCQNEKKRVLMLSIIERCFNPDRK